jgi:hypothetical protein
MAPNHSLRRTADRLRRIRLKDNYLEHGRTALSLSLKSFAEWHRHSAVSGTQFHNWRGLVQSCKGASFLKFGGLVR